MKCYILPIFKKIVSSYNQQQRSLLDIFLFSKPNRVLSYSIVLLVKSCENLVTHIFYDVHVFSLNYRTVLFSIGRDNYQNSVHTFKKTHRHICSEKLSADSSDLRVCQRCSNFSKLSFSLKVNTKKVKQSIFCFLHCS